MYFVRPSGHGVLVTVGRGHPCNEGSIPTLGMHMPAVFEPLVSLGRLPKSNCASRIYLGGWWETSMEPGRSPLGLVRPQGLDTWITKKKRMYFVHSTATSNKEICLMLIMPFVLKDFFSGCYFTDIHWLVIFMFWVYISSVLLLQV